MSRFKFSFAVVLGGGIALLTAHGEQPKKNQQASGGRAHRRAQRAHEFRG